MFRGFFVFIITTLFAAAEVIELTDSNISTVQDIINTGDNAMIYFFAEHCKYCKAFEKAFNFLSEKAVQVTRDPSMSFYKINVVTSPELTMRFFVRFIPRVFHLRGGRIYPLSNEQRADLGKYFDERLWTKIKPVGWFMGPFGLWGTVFGYPARLVLRVLKEAKKRNISNTQLTIISIIAVILLWILAAFLGYITRPVEAKQEIKKKRE